MSRGLGLRVSDVEMRLRVVGRAFRFRYVNKIPHEPLYNKKTTHRLSFGV